MENIKTDFYELNGFVENLRGKSMHFLFGFLIGFEVIGQAKNLSDLLHVSSWFFVAAGILMFIPSIYLMTKYMFPDKYCRKRGMLELSSDGITYRDEASGETKVFDITSLSSVYLRLLRTSRYLYHRHIYKFKWETEGKTETGLIVIHKRYPPVLIALLQEWYSQNSNIYEFNGTGERTFLLKRNYSYLEVQELKRRYGIEWVVGPEESL